MKLNNLFLKSSFIVVSTLLAATGALAKTTEAGKILFVFGEGQIMDSDQNSRPLKRGSVVNSGDKVITENNTRAQLKMNDGSFFSLRPQTQFEIKEYEYSDAATDKSFFGLVKGGFRAITGLIGKKNRSAYSVATPVATMGIRGTHYTALLCQQGDCDTQGGINDGLYVGVAEGGITLFNESGVIDIDPSQFGFVQGPLTAPTILPAPPATLINESSGSGKTAAREESSEGTDQEQQAASDGNEQQSESETGADSQEAKKTEVVQNDGSKLDVSTLSDSTIIIDTTIGKVGPLAVSIDGGSDTSGITSSLTIVNDTQAKLSGFIFENGDSYSSNPETTIDFGYDQATGLAWGRWNSGSFTPSNNPEGTITDATDIHWAVGPKVIMPSTGTASYSLIGGTAPTSGNGTGILGSASMQADFNNQTVNTNISVGMGNDLWKISNHAGTINMSNGTFVGNSNGSGTIITKNSLTTSSFANTYQGAFAGQGASGAVMTYKMDNNAGTVINGSAVFTKK